MAHRQGHPRRAHAKSRQAEAKPYPQRPTNASKQLNPTGPLLLATADQWAAGWPA